MTIAELKAKIADLPDDMEVTTAFMFADEWTTVITVAEVVKAVEHDGKPHADVLVLGIEKHSTSYMYA